MQRIAIWPMENDHGYLFISVWCPERTLEPNKNKNNEHFNMYVHLRYVANSEYV